MTDSGTSPGEALVASTAILTLGAGILAFVTLGRGPAGLVLALGWLVVVPLVAILTEAFGGLDPGGGSENDETAASQQADAALDALRERYARGELSEDEFERRVERLLETETEETARAHLDRRGDADPGGQDVGDREHGRERDPDREREPDTERN